MEKIPWLLASSLSQLPVLSKKDWDVWTTWAKGLLYRFGQLTLTTNLDSHPPTRPAVPVQSAVCPPTRPAVPVQAAVWPPPRPAVPVQAAVCPPTRPAHWRSPHMLLRRYIFLWLWFLKHQSWLQGTRCPWIWSWTLAQADVLAKRAWEKWLKWAKKRMARFYPLDMLELDSMRMPNETHRGPVVLYSRPRPRYG